ncbi:MAG TPA: GNAT family N-acetyltransferase, partial [Tissierellaceae bacterium]
KEYQNNGLGSLLINKLKLNYNSLTLDVYKENTNAYNFYIKNGFRVIDEKIDIINNQIEYRMIWNK